MSAGMAVGEARAAIKMCPVGKRVIVKPRGGGKASGEATVLAVRVSMVLGEELSFYDVEFVESGETAKFIDGMFVEIVDKGYLEAIAPAAIPEPLIMTRARKKRSAADEDATTNKRVKSGENQGENAEKAITEKKPGVSANSATVPSLDHVRQIVLQKQKMAEEVRSILQLSRIVLTACLFALQWSRRRRCNKQERKPRKRRSAY